MPQVNAISSRDSILPNIQLSNLDTDHQNTSNSNAMSPATPRGLERQRTKALLDYIIASDSESQSDDSESDFAGLGKSPLGSAERQHVDQSGRSNLGFMTIRSMTIDGPDVDHTYDTLKSHTQSNSVNILSMMNHLARRRQHNAEWYIIMPDDTFKTVWDWIMLVLLIWIAIFLPLQFGFPEAFGREHKYVLTIDIVVDIFFGIDMVLTCFMAIEEPDGTYIVEVREITRRYVCQGFFFIDLLAIIPFNDLFQASKALKFVKQVRFLRMLKALRLRNLEKKIARYDYDPRFPTGSLRLTKIFLVLLCFMHFTGCFFAYAGSHSGRESWLYEHYPTWEDESTWSVYFLSIYWSTTTLTTVGYGDYSPINDYEIAIAMTTMIVGAIGFSLITGTISSLFATEDQSFSNFRLKMQAVYQFLRKNKQIPEDLTRKLVLVLQEKWKKQMMVQNQSRVDEIYDDLPKGLLKEVVFHVNSKLLEKSVFIRKMSADHGPEAVFHLFEILRRRDVRARELICMEREPVKYVYFIEIGEFGIIDSTAPNEILGAMGPGEHFGHVAEFLNPFHYHVWSVISTCHGLVRVADVEALRQNYQLSQAFEKSAQVRLKKVEAARSTMLDRLATLKGKDGVLKMPSASATLSNTGHIDLETFLDVAEKARSRDNTFDADDVQEIRLVRGRNDMVEAFLSMKRTAKEHEFAHARSQTLPNIHSASVGHFPPTSRLLEVIQSPKHLDPSNAGSPMPQETKLNMLERIDSGENEFADCDNFTPRVHSGDHRGEEAEHSSSEVRG